MAHVAVRRAVLNCSPPRSASRASCAARHKRSVPWLDAVTMPLAHAPAAVMGVRCARNTTRRGRMQAMPTEVVDNRGAPAEPGQLLPPPPLPPPALAAEPPDEAPPQSAACAARAKSASSPFACAVQMRPQLSKLATARTGLPTSPSLHTGARMSRATSHTSTWPLSWPVSSCQLPHGLSPLLSSGTVAGGGMPARVPPALLPPRDSGPSCMLAALLLCLPLRSAAQLRGKIALHAPWAPQRHTSIWRPGNGWSGSMASVMHTKVHGTSRCALGIAIGR